MCTRFLVVPQKSLVVEYRREFEELVAPVPHLTKEVLENTFLNGLNPLLKTEVRCLAQVGLEQIMKTT